MRLFVSLLCATALSAVSWPAQVEVGSAQLGLRGSERFSWLWYTVYDVALHLPAATPREQALAEVPRQLSFRYLRAFSAAELAKATTKTVEERIGVAPRYEIDPGVRSINTLWPSVVKGDELVLGYVPGTGTTVTHNGRILGTVPGAAFSAVLFSIWIGSEPIDDDLRDGLLGK